jgi:DNA-binding protein H-NS
MMGKRRSRLEALAYQAAARYAGAFPSKETIMAKNNLAAMSVEALIEMRDDIGKILSRKTEQLQSQLAALGLGDAPKGKRGASKMKGRKVAPKYRNPKNRSETWAGRGATPRWMAAAIKAGKKKEDFLIKGK